VHAADVDPAAVACARRNLDPARVHEGDLYAALPDALRGRVDLLAVNAPYVPTDEIALMPPEAREHEARVALDGGADGLDVHRRVIAGASAWLAPGGWLLLETSRHQAGRDASLATAAGLAAEIVGADDLDGTAVAARAAP
jgi:release factor glutamine methyltransferase